MDILQGSLSQNHPPNGSWLHLKNKTHTDFQNVFLTSSYASKSFLRWTSTFLETGHSSYNCCQNGHLDNFIDRFMNEQRQPGDPIAVSELRLIHTMAGLERLRSLILWANVVGVLPFRMELDSVTGKFRRFTFSWKDPFVYWPVLFFAIHTSLIIYRHLMTAPFIFSTELPLTHLFTSIILYYDYDFISYVPYLLLYRWKNLEATVKYAHKFDRMIDDEANQPCKTKCRIVIGITLSATLVGWFCSPFF